MGLRSGGAAAAYAAAKAGVIRLAKPPASAIGPHGIRVNWLAPSAVLNEGMATSMTSEQQANLAATFPLSRIGQPDDVANAAVFLLYDAASWLTGVTLDVSGDRIIT